MFRELFAWLIRMSGIPSLIFFLLARKKVSIVLYHDPAFDVFDAHMNYLSEKYKFITLQLLVDAIESKDWSKIPKYAMVVTFDDGHRGNHKLLPLFEKYKLVPTIYTCTGIVGTNRHYWFTKASAAMQRLKSLPHKERLAYLKKTEGFDNEKLYAEDSRQALNDEEVREMNSSVDFQAHTSFHPILTTCPDDDCFEEIAVSKAGVAALDSYSMSHFAYPNGDYGSREIQFCKEAGFRSARTIDTGWNSLKSDPFRLKITGATDTASINILKAQLSGIPSFLRYLSKGSFKGAHNSIQCD